MQFTKPVLFVFFFVFLCTQLFLIMTSTRVVEAEKTSPEIEQATQKWQQGKQLYQKNCSACHGFDGRGLPPIQVGFAEPLPDFTDCSFATREPDADWISIAHSGGPSRGFAKMMPAFGEALSQEQLSLAIQHTRSFCVEKDWPRGELNLPRPMFTEKAYPEDEAVLQTSVGPNDPNSINNKFIYETRIGAQSQIEIIIPFLFLEKGPTNQQTTTESEWQSGIGDIALAFKRAIIHNMNTGSILSYSIETIIPTGKRHLGFGKGTVIIEPFLTYGQLLPWDSFVHCQMGLELPLDEAKAQQEWFWRTAVGTSLTSGQYGRTWSPIVELLMSSETKTNANSRWDIVPQLQVTLSQRQHIMLNTAIRIPLSSQDYTPTEVMAYLLWDWFDGGFFEGW